MRPDDAKKLLGGFAAGMLTEAEEQALYAAALEDQELFDALANEQGLRDLLRDPAAKARLLAALDERPRAWWWSWKPAAVLAMAGVAAIAVMVATRAPRQVEMAIVYQKETAAAPMPAPATVPPPAPAPVQRMEGRQQAPAPAREKKVVMAPAAAVPAAPPEVALAEAQKVGAASGVVGGVPSAFVRREAMADAVVTARGLFFGGQQSLRMRQAANEVEAPPLGLRYTVARDDAGVKVRITANVNGYLSVGGATPVALTAMAPYTTPALSGDVVQLIFARQPVTSAAAQTGVLTEIVGEETYVVSAGGAPLAVTIRLTP